MDAGWWQVPASPWAPLCSTCVIKATPSQARACSPATAATRPSPSGARSCPSVSVSLWSDFWLHIKATQSGMALKRTLVITICTKYIQGEIYFLRNTTTNTTAICSNYGRSYVWPPQLLFGYSVVFLERFFFLSFFYINIMLHCFRLWCILLKISWHL